MLALCIAVDTGNIWQIGNYMLKLLSDMGNSVVLRWLKTEN